LNLNAQYPTSEILRDSIAFRHHGYLSIKWSLKTAS